ncbi:1-deoxy-D-xylulose-5-phosphate synthase [candidate division KSB1 bacterium]|nr:1-deoxy-D-xylulose-5-phosphate synthase [candidate division KSB1 bacterium]
MDILLDRIQSPQDIKDLDMAHLEQLAREIREYIVSTLSETGGHLAPSLGVVELTLALHQVFDSPVDKIVWDVGHQSYAHKIITGRREAFLRIRQEGGISGFPKISESEHDAFGVGHASTAISAAFGMACARDLVGDDYHVMAVVGDGALTGGLSYEGLNNAGASGKNLIVILNDNSMSISPNVGAMAKYLTNIIANPLYNKIKSEIWDFTGKFQKMGPRIRYAARRLEEGLKSFVMPGVLFERLGFRYFGPIDGHNFDDLLPTLTVIKELNGPILLHVLTKKGKGFKPAEKNASVFHGLGRFDKKTGSPIKSSATLTYTQVFGKTICDLAEQHPNLVAITPAMALGTGLDRFAEQFPQRFYDVGIAEGHAVTFAAGLASRGIRPVVAIYSTFLQRAFDHVIHDVCLQNLPVIFALDRAGLVGDDGPTHHGVFDLAYLRTIPNLTIMVPKDENELRQMLYTAVSFIHGPVAIRYPRGYGENVPISEQFTPLPIGKSEQVKKGNTIAVIAVGPLVHRAQTAADILHHEDGTRIEVINARFIKPLDRDMLKKVAKDMKLVITLEEGTLMGGLGSSISEFFIDQNLQTIRLIRCGLPDEFMGQGNRDTMLKKLGLDAEGIAATVRQGLLQNNFHKSKRIRDLFKLSKSL